MNLTHQKPMLPEPSLAQVPTHCIFRHGGAWLAFPATSIRQVMACPQMVSVPRTPATIIGLCHVRSEFIPVLTLDALICERSRSDDGILLIIDDSDGPWGVLVEEVSALKRLEVSDAPESASGSVTSAVTGWATLGDVVIQVLDPMVVRELAERELAVFRASTPARLASRRGIVTGSESSHCGGAEKGMNRIGSSR